MATTTEVKKQVRACPVSPFGIEADHPDNCSLYIQVIPDCRLRSRLIPSRTVVDNKTGEEMVSRIHMERFGTFPEVPGMQLHVDPANKTVTIYDPLTDKPDLCERLARRMNQTNRSATKIRELRGHPTQKIQLDSDSIKTLVFEMIGLLDAGHAKLCKGVVPDQDDIEALDGDELLNPGSRINNTQPRYKKDWETWLANLTKAGG